MLPRAAARQERDLYGAIGELCVSHRAFGTDGGLVEGYASVGVLANFGD